jgi:hypothetical protein
VRAPGCRRDEQPRSPQSASAPLALWTALALPVLPRIYLVVVGDDAAGGVILPLALCILLGYFLIERRSEVAWWLVMFGILFGASVAMTWGVYDAYFAFVVVCYVGGIVCLLLPQAREWVGKGRAVTHGRKVSCSHGASHC